MYTKVTVLSIVCLILSLSMSIAFASVDKEKLKEDYKVPNYKEPLLNKGNIYRTRLGKTLFFDPRLSGSNWISCSTCHNPTLGWSDGLPTAIGEGQKVLNRSTPTILNTAFGFLQMWDGRFRSLEHQALGPIGAKGEMNQDLDALVLELSTIEGYKELFNDAYPGRGLTKNTISLALAAFQRTIISTTAPFDRWVSGDDKAISVAAKRGFELFEGRGNCSKCHHGYNFTDNGFHNIGLDDDDMGRYAIRKVRVLKGAFKTPTLRNITLTAPYMHNGAYATLDEVIEHYVKGGIRKTHLSPSMKKAKLNKLQTLDLIEFLKTLTSAPSDMVYPDMPN